MLFEYKQTNSGGSFVFNDTLTVYNYIEANSPEEANSIAESMGIYFNGCDDGYDCECCGDRWSEPWTETTMEDLISRLNSGRLYRWSKTPISLTLLGKPTRLFTANELTKLDTILCTTNDLTKAITLLDSDN